MTRTLRRALLASAAVAALAATALAGSAQANVQIPGLNGKIAFVSTRDFLLPPITKGEAQFSCFDQQGATEDCELEIYSMNPDGSAQTRLTNNVAGDIEPAWSPIDGSTIAFESDRNSVAVKCEQCYSLFSMPGAGESAGAAQQLTHGDNDVHPSYSPDGTHIAYAGLNPDTQKAPRQIVTFEVNAPNEIFIIPATGGTPTPLLPSNETGRIAPNVSAVDSNPAWSPDGTKIAFTRYTQVFPTGSASRVAVGPSVDIRTYVAPANGSGPPQPVETYDACSNPDSAQQLASALASTNPVQALQAKGFTPPPGCNFDIKPAWSPDGTKIAVTRLTGASIKTQVAGTRGFPFGSDFGDIVVIDPTTGNDVANLSNVTEPTDCNMDNDKFCSVDEYPSWSPDGTKIAFDSDRGSDGLEQDGCFGEGGFGCFNVWTMNADGSGPVQLTASGSGDNFFPDWQRIPPPVIPPATPPVTPAAVPPKVGVAGVRRACVSKSFHVRFHITTTASSVKSVVVKLDGRRIKRTSRGSFTLTINAKKLRAGRHRLTITATDSHGKVTTAHKSFSVCKAAKPRKRTAPRFTG